MTAYSRTLGARHLSVQQPQGPDGQGEPPLARATPWPASRRRTTRSASWAQMVLADVPLKTFLSEALIPYEDDEVTRLIVDSHDAAALGARSRISPWATFRNWLLSDAADEASLGAPRPPA